MNDKKTPTINNINGAMEGCFEMKQRNTQEQTQRS